MKNETLIGEEVQPEPFVLEAWKAFASKDRFLAFQMWDLIARCERTVHPSMTFERSVAVYLEAQYNGTVFENSVMCREWNRFARRYAAAHPAVVVGVVEMCDESTNEVAVGNGGAS